MADVSQCIDYLKNCSSRWQVAGRGWQLLREVVSLGNAQPCVFPSESSDNSSSVAGHSMNHSQTGVTLQTSSASAGELHHKFPQMNGPLEFGIDTADTEYSSISSTPFHPWMPWHVTEEGMGSIPTWATMEWATVPANVFDGIFGAEWLETVPHPDDPTPTIWDGNAFSHQSATFPHVLQNLSACL
jgi:hypothetical protein